MSERAPYSRIYWSLVDDPKFAGIYDDNAAFAWWVRLLMVADQAYPASAHVPGGVPRRVLVMLVDHGIIDQQPGGRYRIHGLDAERERRSASASASASLRWSRPRTEGGKPVSRGKRFKVLQRDEFKCRYCGASGVPLDVDHVVPVRDGGTDDLDNLVAACVDCNIGKSGHPLRAHPPRNARASERALLDETRRDETRRDEPRRDEDYVVAFFNATGRAPTKAQRAVLWELYDRHSTAWLVEHLTGDDPFRAALDADTEWQRQRRAEVAAEEAEARREKKRQAYLDRQALMREATA